MAKPSSRRLHKDSEKAPLVLKPSSAASCGEATALLNVWPEKETAKSPETGATQATGMSIRPAPQ